MKNRAANVLALALVLIPSSALRSQPFQDETRQQVPRRATLRDRAVEAKALGKHEVTLGVPSDIPQIVPSLDHALAYFKVIVGWPIATQTVVEHGSNIVTWYKFRIASTLSNRPHSLSSITVAILSDEMKPTQLLPISEDDVVVLRSGGTTVVDGVTITARDPRFPPFDTSKSYLLFLTDSSDGLAYVGMEAAGVFEIENGKLLPWGPVNHPVIQDLKNLYDNSLSKAQKAIQGHASK